LDELLDVVELDELEGVGQSKRLTARVCATIHNEFARLTWIRFGSKDIPPPTPAQESDYLPRRVKPVNSVGRVQTVDSSGQAIKPKTRAEAVSASVTNAFAEMFTMYEKY
jgi:hypothetical protein